MALGVSRDGVREVLGLWIADNEGAKFWLSVMNELKNRGVQDVLIAVVDGLRGFPEAITAAFPDAAVQTCIVHLVRHSLNFCAWKDRKAVAADLRLIYGAPMSGAISVSGPATCSGCWTQSKARIFVMLALRAELASRP